MLMKDSFPSFISQFLTVIVAANPADLSMRVMQKRDPGQRTFFGRLKLAILT